MVFFNRKKDDGFKLLTEEEIQKKLYGEYKPGNAKLVDESVVAQKNSDKSDKYEQSIRRKVKVIDGNSGEKEKTFSKEKESDNDLFSYLNETFSASAGVENFQSIDANESNKKAVSNISIEMPDENKNKYSAVMEKKESVTATNYASPYDSEENYLSSLKIDLMEMASKLKKKLPYILALIGILFVVLVVSFNIWTRNTGEPEKNVRRYAVGNEKRDSMQMPEKEVYHERAVVVSKVSGGDAVPVKKNGALPEKEKSGAHSEEAAGVKNYHYTLQVCTYYNEDMAENLVAKLKDKGYDAFFIKEKTRRRGKNKYSVVIGRYVTSKEATKALNDFKNTKEYKTFSDSFIKWIK